MVTVEWNILISVGGLAVDVEVEGVVGVADDCDVKHGNPAVLFHFFGPFYVGMDGIEVVV